MRGMMCRVFHFGDRRSFSATVFHCSLLPSVRHFNT